MESILVRDGTSPRVLGIFFKAGVQAIIIFRPGMWMMNPRMGRAMVSFQHMVERWITGRNTKQQDNGGWEYPLLQTEREEEGFEEMEAYVLER